MLIYHKLENKPEMKLQTLFDQEIIERIKDKYEKAILEHDELGKEGKNLKQFTVTVLLKLQH